MSTIDTDYEKYLEFSGRLEEDLSKTYGETTAATLYRRMNRIQFEEFVEAAAVDPIKQRWLARFRASYEDVMSEWRAA